MIVKEIQKTALFDALATTLYIIIVSGFMFFGSTLKLGRVNTILTPIAFLLLFVFSTALTGYLIFGKPAQMYIDGKKKEALSLLSFTMMFFSIITFISILLLLIFTI